MKEKQPMPPHPLPPRFGQRCSHCSAVEHLWFDPPAPSLYLVPITVRTFTLFSYLQPEPYVRY